MVNSPPQPDSAKPTVFQRLCIRRIGEILASHGLQTPTFQRQDRGWFLGEFRFRERAYRIEVYGDMVVMHEGRYYYEPYMREEFKSDQTLVDGFATRLDRLLSGGQWEGPDEGMLSAIKVKLTKLFRAPRRKV